MNEKSTEKIRIQQDPWNIIIHPLMTEKSMGLVEKENKLIFIVNKESNKNQIKNAVEKIFEVKVDKVTVAITRDGTKKAYVKLKKGFSAAEIATRLGML